MTRCPGYSCAHRKEVRMKWEVDEPKPDQGGGTDQPPSEPPDEGK